MPIVMRLDRVMADRKISATELAQRIGSTPVNISRIKNGHIRGIRFSTLEQLCIELKCAPGDLIEYMDDNAYKAHFGRDQNCENES